MAVSTIQARKTCKRSSNPTALKAILDRARRKGLFGRCRPGYRTCAGVSFSSCIAVTWTLHLRLPRTTLQDDFSFFKLPCWVLQTSACTLHHPTAWVFACCRNYTVTKTQLKISEWASNHIQQPTTVTKLNWAHMETKPKYVQIKEDFYWALVHKNPYTPQILKKEKKKGS